LVASRLEPLRFAAGQVIVHQGGPADRLYILRHGSVELLRDGAVAARLGPGDSFGDLGLLGEAPQSATVRAASSVDAVSLSRQAFAELIVETDLTSTEVRRLLRRRVIASTLALALPSLLKERGTAVLGAFDLQELAPGQTIIRQGDPAEHFYVVARGAVEVVKEGPHGDAPLRTLSAGDYFGEIGLLRAVARTATVRVTADAPAQVLVMPRAAFLNAVAESERTGADITQTMFARLLAHP
jgi:CRP-like cAMP-binding protein